jgi:ankyrin repeat protein
LIFTVIVACECSALGDLEGVIRLNNMGVSLEDGDYDKRTPLHLAAANNHIKIV